MQAFEDRRPLVALLLYYIAALKSRALGLLNPKVSRTHSPVLYVIMVSGCCVNRFCQHISWWRFLGNSNISVQCEIVSAVCFIDAIQIFYLSQCLQFHWKAFIWINPTDITDKKPCSYRVRIYNSIVPGTNLIASSNNVKLTQAHQVNFMTSHFHNLSQGVYIWKLECLSGYCGFAHCYPWLWVLKADKPY